MRRETINVALFHDLVEVGYSPEQAARVAVRNSVDDKADVTAQVTPA